MKKKEDILRTVRENNIELIRFLYTDNDGVIRGYAATAESLETDLDTGHQFAVAMLFATGALFFQHWKKTASIVISICCVLIFIFSTGLFIHKINRNNTVREAIIMLDEVKAYSGPGQDNTHIFTIHEGTKVVIERQENSWNLIRLKSGAGGWIHSEAMEEI